MLWRGQWIARDKGDSVDRTHQLPNGRQTGSYPETGFEEISGDLLQADFWTARMSAPILTPAHDNVLYYSPSAMASAEVNFWFTCHDSSLDRTDVAKGGG